MKKLIFALFIVILFTLQISGCAESTTSKSESEIREIAYLSIEGGKQTIIDWQTATVEEYKSETDHTVFCSSGSDDIIPNNIKGMDTYKVTFRTKHDAFLGPITRYVDKRTYEVLGGDAMD